MAMETNNIEQPRAIVFINNNHIAVGGKNGCAIFDGRSQQLIKKLTPSSIKSLVANKDIIAILGKDKTKKKPKPKLTVFDITTHEKKWSEKNYDCNLTLSSIDNSLFTSSGCETLKQYNYKKQETENTGFSLQCPRLYHLHDDNPISCHPTNNSLLYSDGADFFITHPSTKQGNRELKCVELRHLQCIGIHDSPCGVEGGIWSPDGNKILFKYNRVPSRKHASYFIYNMTDTKKIAHYILDSQKYSAFAFHPTISLLAALSCENRVKFWDYVSHTLIATTDQLSQNIDGDTQEKRKKSFTQRLSFSPDGSQLAVALPDAWHVIQTSHINTNDVNLIFIPESTEPDITQEMQYKCIRDWVHFEDPNAEEEEYEYYEL
jgi:WD40 repeat protein